MNRLQTHARVSGCGRACGCLCGCGCISGCKCKCEWVSGFACEQRVSTCVSKFESHVLVGECGKMYFGGKIRMQNRECYRTEVLVGAYGASTTGRSTARWVSLIACVNAGGRGCEGA